jgi:hypothetical protein
MTVALVGADTIKVNQRLLTDFPDGDVAKLTFDADNVTVKVGKNGNTIYVANQSGRKAKLELRVMRGSDDDKYLTSQQTLQNSNLPAAVLMSGEIVKVIGDGLGNLTTDNYILTGGAFTKQVEVTSNVEGEKEQAVSIYSIEWAGAPRALS